jgi:hypothetical protein
LLGKIEQNRHIATHITVSFGEQQHLRVKEEFLSRPSSPRMMPSLDFHKGHGLGSSKVFPYPQPANSFSSWLLLPSFRPEDDLVFPLT